MSEESESDGSAESAESAESIDMQTGPTAETDDHTQSGEAGTTNTLSTDQLYNVFETAGRPVVTASTIARHFSESQATITEQLSTLIDTGVVDRIAVDDDPVVYYPTSLSEMTTRERIVVFPDRREIIVDNPTQYTRAQLTQFAYLADTTGKRQPIEQRGPQVGEETADRSGTNVSNPGETTVSENVDSDTDADTGVNTYTPRQSQSRGYLYRVRQEDIWQAPFDDLGTLISVIRSTLPRRVPELESWVETQWKRANRFRLFTHDDGYVVLEAASESLMGNVARQKLSEDQLRAPVSDTESWVNSDEVASVKRVLYEAGYPVVDERDLDTGDPIDVDLTATLREYQQSWVDTFLDQQAGVYVGPPGSGKTIAATATIAAVGGETLILVPSRELAAQWRKSLTGESTLTDDQIGEYHGGEKNIRSVTIATYQTAGMDRHRQLFDSRKWGLIVYDEVQHIPSDVFRRSADLQTSHRLGLSVHGETIIPVKRGDTVSVEPIEEFVSDYLDEESGISSVSEVETIGVTKQGKVVWTPVTAAMRHRNTADLYTVQADNGQKVTVTEDHSLLVYDSKERAIVERTPTELEEGEYLLQPTTVPEINDEQSRIDVLSLLDEGYILLNDEIPESAFEPLYDQQTGTINNRYNWRSGGSLPISVAREIELDRSYIDGVYKQDKQYQIPPSVDMVDFARLVGLFVADGAMSERCVEFYATDSAEGSEIEAFESAIRAVVPDAEPNRMQSGQNCTTLCVGGPLIDVLKQLAIDDGVRQKSIPPFIFSTESAREGFIQGIELGDGYHQQRSQDRECATISTSSEEFTQGLNLVLAAGGCVGGNYRRSEDITAQDRKPDIVEDSLVQLNPKNRFKTPRNAIIPFSGQLRKAYGSIGRTPNHNHEDQRTRVGPTLKKGLTGRQRITADEIELLGEHGDIPDGRRLLEADVAMLSIDSVTPSSDTEYVYDLSTETENFLGNHLFCHNSATPVREDDKESEIFTLIGPPIGTDWAELFDAGFVAEPEVEIRYVPWRDEMVRNEYASADGRERYQLAATNPAKIAEIRYLCETHPNSKTLIFVDYLDQGKEIAEALDTPFISGETRHYDRQQQFEAFRNGELQTLVVSRIADEGIDLPNAELAIVASGLGGSRRQGTQRAGRTMRPVGSAVMYVLATRGTREEDFAQQQMRHLAGKGVRIQETNVSE